MESSRAAAEASRSRRRARVPSFTTLQAASMVEVEGVQWMNRTHQQKQGQEKRENEEMVRERHDMIRQMNTDSAEELQPDGCSTRSKSMDAATGKAL